RESLRLQLSGDSAVELDVGELVAFSEVANVPRHPGARRFGVAPADGFVDAPLGHRDARACLWDFVDHDAQRRLEESEQRLLREAEHLVVRGPPDAAEELGRMMHGLLGLSILIREALTRRREALEVGRGPVAGCNLRHRRLELRQRLPDLEERHVVQREGPADILGDRAVLRATHRHQLRARAALQQPATFELAQGLAYRRAVDAELAGELRLGWQPLALTQLAAENAIGDGGGDLAVARYQQDLIELDAHAALS